MGSVLHRSAGAARVDDRKVLYAGGNRGRTGAVDVGMSIDGLLARQGGVISREQAMAAGLSPGAVDHRLRRRRWCPIHPRVYLAAGHATGHEARIHAAVLWAGEGAVLSGVAAAWWFGMVEQPPPRITLAVGRARQPRARAGVDIRCRTLAATDVAVLRGLSLTARPLTVLEAAVELGAAGDALLDRALQGMVTFGAVFEAHRRHLGTAGSAAAGRVLAAAADRSAIAACELLGRLLLDAGAAGWSAGSTGSGGRIETHWHRSAAVFPAPTSPTPSFRAATFPVVVFPAGRVVIEVTGWAWRPAAPEHDASRTAPGWTALRFTWQELTERPRAVLSQIASVVDRGMASRRVDHRS